MAKRLTFRRGLDLERARLDFQSGMDWLNIGIVDLDIANGIGTDQQVTHSGQFYGYKRASGTMQFQTSHSRVPGFLFHDYRSESTMHRFIRQRLTKWLL
jgi:hypothetical protein